MADFPRGAQDVRDPAGVARVEKVLSGAPEAAVDLEADAMYAFRARLCFVQIGTTDDVFLLDTLEPSVSLEPLTAFFADPSRTKFFHAAGGDLQFLAEAGVRVKGLFDTHRAATLLGWPKVGLADLARERLGIELPKEHQQSDFSLRPLPDEMREYIANDVRYLVEIGHQVRAACEAADILEEVLLDCERMTDDACARPDLTAFEPKIPRGGQSPEQMTLARAIARALHLKRLEWAEAADVPMGRMLSNMALSGIAVRRPSERRALSKIIGVRGPFVREHGEDVLALVRDLVERADRGELPPDAPKGKGDPGRRKRDELLRAFRVAKATERNVTPSVVLSNPLMAELSAHPPDSVESLARVPYFGAKRTALYGAELVALLKP